MLVFSRLGKKGNFGNHLFQIASTIGIAIKNAHGFAFPRWEYAKYFIYDFPLYDEKLKYHLIKENTYHFSNIELKEGNYDLNGWFQSEKYFNVDAVKMCFKFRPEIINQVKIKYKKALSKKYILISVRRGDFVNNPYYFQLDYKYYFLAITRNFNDWQNRTLIFTSDDIEYCKKHFQFLPNAIFIEKSNVIEQLALGSLCHDFVISNSTFSWWMAWLGENKESKVLRPIKNFRGKFGTINNDKDYFPERWLAFNSKSERIELKYYKLIVKGEFLKAIENVSYYYRFSVKEVKRFIKKIIGRK
ncbi:hypothetical protein APS56_05290 [Pseudalgibacter alginicilyticus]|uniref:Alpha-1,2-fucosyltransferase n=1 Tax=Pseudalgibacter alginicilyticus TaxID=1736674 RepID=A0A0P0CF07_9FLAO|nr:alpha-1,2-fucosyltransferase [Pseudalgibacter alginicilyticus]ALJ04587.1 hypothetical protein APS56_05290 [Pseudalgibacter alginicilyticus]